MSLNTTLSNLRGLAHAEPSRAAWRRICDALDDAPEGDALAITIDYLNTHLEAWPDALRLAPPDWYQRQVIDWDQEPRWPLVRALELELIDQRPQLLIQRLVDTGALEPVTWLQLRTRQKRAIRDPKHRLQGSDVAYLASHPLSRRLKHLDLRGHALGPEGTRYLALSPILSRLTHLDLARNDVGDEGARIVAASPRAGELTALDLSCCDLSDDGAAALAEAPWEELERLTLKLNNIGLPGAEALARSRTLPAPLRARWEERAAAPPLRFIVQPWGRSFTVLAGERVQLGRDPENDLVLPYPTVSPHQCNIVHEGDAVTMHNRRSRFGRSEPTELKLNVGDVIQLGPVTARVMAIP
ncbi:MAG: hypothetical protein CMH57_10095 [Myxococcales bacterium]|nr:hypothetical protein [Myxococcales bacterium]